MAGERKTFILINDRIRHNAITAIANAPADYIVTIAPKTRTTDQNAKLHAMLTDLARSPFEWFGKRRPMESWKALMISGHSIATKQGGEVVPGLEGEFVAIRESSASMSVSRAASLIEYLTAFCAEHGIEMHDTRHGGFYDERSAS